MAAAFRPVPAMVLLKGSLRVLRPGGPLLPALVRRVYGQGRVPEPGLVSGSASGWARSPFAAGFSGKDREAVFLHRRIAPSWGKDRTPRELGARVPEAVDRGLQMCVSEALDFPSATPSTIEIPERNSIPGVVR